MESKLLVWVIPSPVPGMGGWGNGYVGIPEGHPCYGMHYDEIHNNYNIEVHGGLTCSEWYDAKHFPESMADMWIVGFDTLHYGDDIQKWPNASSVMREALRLKEQFEQIK